MDADRILRLVGYMWRHVIKDMLVSLAQKTDTPIDNMVIDVVDRLLTLGE